MSGKKIQTGNKYSINLLNIKVLIHNLVKCMDIIFQTRLEFALN